MGIEERAGGHYGRDFHFGTAFARAKTAVTCEYVRKSRRTVIQVTEYPPHPTIVLHVTVPATMGDISRLDLALSATMQSGVRKGDKEPKP